MNNEIDVRTLCTGVYDERANDKGVISRFYVRKYHLIKSHFVPPINYKFPTRFLHQCRRGFQSRYLDEYSWMVYSPSVDEVFCKHCALMITMHCMKDKGAFVNNPFILT